jgi:uncharacterized MAPEG superfamily protein
MDSVIGSLLVLCILPLACAWTAGYFRKQQLGTIDNKEPRTQALQLTGAGARSVAAQSNSWEALAVFSAAVLAIVVSGAGLDSVANLAIVFTVLRVLYIPLYVGGKDALRSLVFLTGYGICMYMFYIALSN